MSNNASRVAKLERETGMSSGACPACGLRRDEVRIVRYIVGEDKHKPPEEPRQICALCKLPMWLVLRIVEEVVEVES
jgi:hypothetical protein